MVHKIRHFTGAAKPGRPNDRVSPEVIRLLSEAEEHHSLPVERAWLSGMSTGPWPTSDSIRPCLYVSLPCGKERDREGT
jgi:hypothetical protein